jgi:uncharacterized protein (TIGR02246 family)
MKTPWINIVFLGFSLAVSVSSFSQSTDKTHSNDVDAIKKTAADLDEAYNRRNAEAFTEFFMEDADFQWHTGEVLKDREQISQYFTSAFKTMPADYRHITTFERIRFIGPDVAIGDGTLVIAQEGAKETDEPYLSVLFTCIGKKVEGQWKLEAIRLILPKKE